MAENNRTQRYSAEQHPQQNYDVYDHGENSYREDDRDYDRGQYSTRRKQLDPLDTPMSESYNRPYSRNRRDIHLYDDYNDYGSNERGNRGREWNNRGQFDQNYNERNRGWNDRNMNFNDRGMNSGWNNSYDNSRNQGYNSYPQNSFGNQRSDYGGSYLENEGYGNRRSDSYGSQSWEGSYGNNYNSGLNTGNYDTQWNYGQSNSGQGNYGQRNLMGNENMGQHRGKGPKGYKRSDERIKEDINDRLSDDAHLDASGIEVNVNNGEVSLSGTVSDRNSKRRAEDIVDAISGVQNVENKLRLKQEQHTDKDTLSSTRTSEAERHSSVSSDNSRKHN